MIRPVTERKRLMHDPNTMAFRIPNPLDRRYRGHDGKPQPRWSARPALITIWHVDPETDGTENSCNWTNRRGRRTRWWHLHPRWHVHHWRIEWTVFRDLRYWLTRRCTWCGKRYGWQTGVLGTHWPSGATFHPTCKREFSRRQEQHYRAMLEREATEFVDGIVEGMIAEAAETDLSDGRNVH